MSASGNMTDHYLNPVVPENYTNNGTTGSFSLSYERDLTPKDRLTLIVRHELARYADPQRTGAAERSVLAERGQQHRLSAVPPARSRAIACSFPAGSCRPATTLKPWGAFPTSTFFPPTRSAWLRGMARDNSNDFYSNPMPHGPSLQPSTTTSRRSISTAASPFIMAGRNGRRASNPTPSSCTKTSAT